MSEKMSCPACSVYSSSVLGAFVNEDDCPYCGLPASAALSISNARARGADKMLTDRVAEVEVELAKLERENTKMKRLIETIQETIEETM
jgi:hypothetical protein